MSFPVGREDHMGHHRDSHASSFRSTESGLERRAIRWNVPAIECEDCFQEGWLALLERHPDWEPEEPRARAFLIAVAHNTARDFHRHQKRHRVLHLDDVPPISVLDPVQAPPELDQTGRDQEVLSKLRDSLNRLSEVNREIFLSRAMLGLTYREIGLAMNLEAEQVKKRYYRLLHRLQKELRPCARGNSDAWVCDGKRGANGGR